MKRSARPWLKRLQTFLNLEILEERTPVSEGLRTLVSLTALPAAGRALALMLQSPPSPVNQLSRFTRSDVVSAKVPRSPGDVSPAPERGAQAPAFRLTQPVPATPPARPQVSPLPDPVSAGLGTEDIALFDALELAKPLPQRSGGFGSSRDTLPISPSAGGDFGQQPSVAPDGGSADRRIAGRGTEWAPVTAASQADAATLALMLGAGLGAAGQPAQAAAGGNVFGGAGGGSDSSGSGGPLIANHRRGRPSKNGDPLWVLDVNDRMVLPDASTVPAGYTINSYSGWSMSLYAQVSGATVQSYSWTLTGNDFASHGSLTSYNLQFTWGTVSGSTNHTDSVSLTTTNVGGGGETQTFNFTVISQDNPGYQSTRPTTAPSFPLLVPPDAVKPGQEMIHQPFYSLGEDTGEVQTSFTLPGYNPGITPLQLDYSSTAADPAPIFTGF